MKVPTLGDNIDYLKKVGWLADEDIDLAEAALVIASIDRPGISLQKYHHHLKILGLDLANDAGSADTGAERARALAEVMWGRHGYRGNEKFYDDLQNANLMSVIDRRLGLPVSVSILYMHAARSRGWRAEGLNFPAHFLVRLYGENDQVIIDPYHQGRILDVRDLRKMIRHIGGAKAELDPSYFEAVGNRYILLRLLNNIKNRCLQVSDITYAISVIERISHIDPGQLEHKYELGILQAHTGKLDDARSNLVDCLEMIEREDHIDGVMKQQILRILKEIRTNYEKPNFALIGNDFEKE